MYHFYLHFSSLQYGIHKYFFIFFISKVMLVIGCNEMGNLHLFLLLFDCTLKLRIFCPWKRDKMFYRLVEFIFGEYSRTLLSFKRIQLWKPVTYRHWVHSFIYYGAVVLSSFQICGVIYCFDFTNDFSTRYHELLFRKCAAIISNLRKRTTINSNDKFKWW